MDAEITVASPIGPLLLTAGAEGLTGVRPTARPAYSGQATPLLREAERQFRQYFYGSRQAFDLPLSPQGTEFQLLVWQALRQIPWGATLSYGELARKIGRSRSVRAVGGAAHRNPLLILIPCHRLLGADGSLTGFAAGLEAKEYLLRLEGAAFREGAGPRHSHISGRRD
ncbi:MAG: methylated-DNA--[Firmicutes bacterium]|nr:methylated-DNA--[protein]-cysteine S-methyltransferase [Bacillota bacterium]